MTDEERAAIYMDGYREGYQDAANDAQDLLWANLTRMQEAMDNRCMEMLRKAQKEANL